MIPKFNVTSVKKLQKKKVTDCENALVQETAKGTDATNWWKKTM